MLRGYRTEVPITVTFIIARALKGDGDLLRRAPSLLWPAGERERERERERDGSAPPPTPTPLLCVVCRGGARRDSAAGGRTAGIAPKNSASKQ